MTNEERDLIAKFIARVGGQPQATGSWGGSVPSSTPALPPIDRDADQFIAQQLQTHPEARYRITQMAFVQEAALVEAQNRIKRLEWEVEQTRNAAQQAAQQGQPQQSRGILGSLFGGGQPQRGGPLAGYQPTTPPPQPQYPPQYQPGMFGRPGGGGTGFLGTALAGAAGVAGGMMLANMFTGHGSSAASTVSDTSGGMFGGGGLFGGGSSSGSPFDTAGGSVGTDPAAGFADASGGGDPWASGGATKDFASNNTSDQGFWSNDGASQPVSDNSGDAFGDAGGGGWDSGSGGFDDNG